MVQAICILRAGMKKKLEQTKQMYHMNRTLYCYLSKSVSATSIRVFQKRKQTRHFIYSVSSLWIYKEVTAKAQRLFSERNSVIIIVQHILCRHPLKCLRMRVSCNTTPLRKFPESQSKNCLLNLGRKRQRSCHIHQNIASSDTLSRRSIPSPNNH